MAAFNDYVGVCLLMSAETAWKRKRTPSHDQGSVWGDCKNFVPMLSHGFSLNPNGVEMDRYRGKIRAQYGQRINLIAKS